MARRARVKLDGHSLTPERVEAIAWRQARAELAPSARRAMEQSRRLIERKIRAGETVYGVNTGFGHLASISIDRQQLGVLQQNLIRSHASGVGACCAPEIVRALLVLRAQVLARGHSGVRPIVAERLLQLLDRDLLPVVPEQGSVGASGDLAPLAHVAWTMIGEGQVHWNGKVVPTKRALRQAGFSPLQLEPKEGLALVNGTQFSGAIATLALRRAERAAQLADVACAMTVDALLGTGHAFDPRIHAQRPHPGQRAAANNMHRLLRGSPIWNSHAECGRVQDAYSLRCAPQVHGVARDTLRQLRDVVSIELNSSTDNPMVLARDGEVLSGGNFHAAPLAAACDFAAIALTTLASISERRIDRLVNPLVSGLPAFLADNPGLESGMMMAHVTAAALVSENKTLAHPGSVDSIPTSANQEDHVSMAPWCARKLIRVLENLERVLAIELLAATRALDFHRPLRSTPSIEAVRRQIKSLAPLGSGDQSPTAAIEILAGQVRRGTLLAAVAGAGVRLD